MSLKNIWRKDCVANKSDGAHRKLLPLCGCSAPVAVALDSDPLLSVDLPTKPLGLSLTATTRGTRECFHMPKEITHGFSVFPVSIALMFFLSNF